LKADLVTSCKRAYFLYQSSNGSCPSVLRLAFFAAMVLSIASVSLAIFAYMSSLLVVPASNDLSFNISTSCEYVNSYSTSCLSAKIACSGSICPSRQTKHRLIPKLFATHLVIALIPLSVSGSPCVMRMMGFDTFRSFQLRSRLIVICLATVDGSRVSLE